MKIPAKKYISCALISLIVLLLAVFTVLRPIFVRTIPAEGELVLTATGEKNPLSAGTEVRIKEIKIDGESVELSELAAAQGWKMDGELLAAYGVETPASLYVDDVSAEELTIEVVKQRGSGLLEIFFGAVQTPIDVYSDSDWDEETLVFALGSDEFAPFRRPDLFLELWALLATLLLMGENALKRE